ncbi:MAG: NAD-dependent DNA ligase LigA [Saprospiraceae bacterium]|nr:NAD-dependent DNA ligase LigA [Saprospiraceae bacterium]
MYSKEHEQQLYDLSKILLAMEPEDSVDPSQTILDLTMVIQYHEWKYYVQSNPVISDFEYDQLYKKLEVLEEEHPDLTTLDSPTQRISSDLTSDFPTVSHLAPMLSLANSYDAQDLYDFDKTIKKLMGVDPSESVEYCVEPKYDGGSIALLYESDQLVRAATRGNGQQGDEITANAKTIRSIPLSANFRKHRIERIELRGEAIIRKDTFEKVNKGREEQNLLLFANARNAATGGLRMKDPRETAQRGIEAFIYQISYAEDLEGSNAIYSIGTQWAGMDLLSSLGFKVPNIERKKCTSIDEVIDFCQNWESKRDGYAYEIDGMVVKVNHFEQQHRIGSTSHHPRWAIAYKFKAKQATTKLVHIEYQVGKTGSITPVAKLEPVQLAGVTVSSVSLHNEDFISGKDLRLGDQVIVERAGDVIPYIVKSLPDLRKGDEKIVNFPRVCPINSVEPPTLVREEEEAVWRCPHCTCGAQDLQRLIFHVSKSAMNIDGFGKSIIERFFDMGWLDSLADIYRLDYEKIADMEGFGVKSAARLKSSIDSAKLNPIHRLLHSLSIHHLGRRASKIISEHVHHVLDLAEWSEEDLRAIKDIGPVLARKVISYFQNDENLNILREMESLGVNLIQTKEDKPLVIKSDAIFSGKTILFTGTLQKMGRKEAQTIAEKNGAKSISTVSNNLDILIVGEKAGSKLAKAQKLGTVEIMTEEEFLEKVDW